MTDERSRAVDGASRDGGGEWHVYGWAGDRIGVLKARDDDELVIRLDSISAPEVRVPAALVSDEDAAARRLTLAVDTSELDGVQLQQDGVSLVDGGTD